MDGAQHTASWESSSRGRLSFDEKLRASCLPLTEFLDGILNHDSGLPFWLPQKKMHEWTDAMNEGPVCNFGLWSVAGNADGTGHACNETNQELNIMCNTIPVQHTEYRVVIISSLRW